jgi:uncharacterized membrane protein
MMLRAIIAVCCENRIRQMGFAEAIRLYIGHCGSVTLHSIFFLIYQEMTRVLRRIVAVVVVGGSGVDWIQLALQGSTAGSCKLSAHKGNFLSS